MLVEPGNDLPAPGVGCVRGFARQPPIPRQGTLVTSRMEVRSALGPAITRAGGIKPKEPNLLIEAIQIESRSSRPTFATVLMSLREIGARGSGLGGLAVEPLGMSCSRLLNAHK